MSGELETLYRGLLDAWNSCDAEAFAALFADDGETIGFDGSSMNGRDAIAEELGRIFADHDTGAYTGIVRRVQELGEDACVLRAVAGMVPAGASDIEPKLNVQQTLLAERRDGAWKVVLYQNTPAQLHGREELADDLTRE